jgi:hypothetical protein
MGSLMPGWDILPDPQKVMKRSKTSMTNEEIEAFWRHKQQEIELHAKKDDDRNANSRLNANETKQTTTVVTADGATTHEAVVELPQPLASSRDWWTRSNWAYLNAPPDIPDHPGHSRHRPYVPQHDVANRYTRSISAM